MIKKCSYCGQNFETLRSESKYCNMACYLNDPNSKQRNRKRVIIECLNCHIPFKVKPYLASIRKYCSRGCANIYNQKDGSWNKGIPHTEEEKQKISIGSKLARENGSYINPATRPEVRAKISRTIIALFKDPKNNPRYIDGRSGEQYPFEFNESLKEQIRARDNYTCQECGIPQDAYMRSLDVHHKDGDKYNLNADNLITLCLSCHMKKHGTFEDYNRRKVQSRRLQSVVLAQNS